MKQSCNRQGRGRNLALAIPQSYDRGNRTPTELLVDARVRRRGLWRHQRDLAQRRSAGADRRRRIELNALGGYSSGGDLGYRMMFDHSLQFAGLLAENTSPFRDTGQSEATSLAQASWKFKLVHLAHTEEDTYAIAGVAMSGVPPWVEVKFIPRGDDRGRARGLTTSYRTTPQEDRQMEFKIRAAALVATAAIAPAALIAP